MPRLLSALLLSLLLAACDGTGAGEPLAPGEFEATVRGAVDDRYRGGAAFTDTVIAADTLAANLDLLLSAAGDGAAVYLAVAWGREPGTFPLDENSFSHLVLRSSATSGAAVPYDVVSGSVTVTRATGAEVAGSFAVVAESRLVPGGGPEVRAEGAFVAVADTARGLRDHPPR